jgi:hypothetical protein
MIMIILYLIIVSIWFAIEIANAPLVDENENIIKKPKKK